MKTQLQFIMYKRVFYQGIPAPGWYMYMTSIYIHVTILRKYMYCITDYACTYYSMTTPTEATRRNFLQIKLVNIAEVNNNFPTNDYNSVAL